MRSTHTPDSGAPASRSSEFTATHWSVVVAAGDTQTPQSAEALETLCRAYWFPLYAYVRRQGASPEEAEDLTQEFFAGLFKKCVQQAKPESGRFRTFLLTSLKHYLVSEWRKTERLKRGSGQSVIPWDATLAEQWYSDEPPAVLTSERIYEKRWAITLMERVLARLHDECHAAGHDRLFAAWQQCVWGVAPPRPYAEIARELGLTAAAVKTNVHRLRLRCRQRLRAEVAHTVARPEEIDEELRHLIEVFSE